MHVPHCPLLKAVDARLVCLAITWVQCDDQLRGAASHEAEGRGGARGGEADRVGPPASWRRLRLLGACVSVGPILVPGDSPSGHEAAGGAREATPNGRVWALRRRVASSLPACTRRRARGVLVFGDVGPPRRCVCHDRGPVRIGGPCVSRGAQAGGVRPLPPPATRRCGGAVRLYAVPRRTRRRGDAVRGAAGPAVWGRRRAGTACACCARYSTSWFPASSSSCS